MCHLPARNSCHRHLGSMLAETYLVNANMLASFLVLTKPLTACRVRATQVLDRSVSELNFRAIVDGLGEVLFQYPFR